MQSRGSFTVEASITMPVVIMILVGLLYISMYVHDHTILQAALDEGMTKMDYLESNSFWQDELYFPAGLNYESIIRVTIKSRLDGKLFCSSIDSLTIKCDVKESVVKRKLEVTAYLMFTTPFTWLNSAFKTRGDNGIMMKSKAYGNFYNPTEIVRLVDFVDDLTSEMSFLKPFKNKYLNIIKDTKKVLDKLI